VNETITALLADHGAITVAGHPRLRSSLIRLAQRGFLANPLPGTYVRADDTSDRSWLRAVCAWSAPHGVLHGATAAALWLAESSMLPTTRRTTELAHPTLTSRGRITVAKRVVPPEFVRVSGGLRFATPAYAAVELAAVDDGRAICEALRQRLATLSELEAALQSMTGSHGQAVRRRVVEACLRRPWSYAELRLQRILTAHGITEFLGNEVLKFGGQVFFADVLFPDLKVIIEFDGRATHDNPAQYLADRERLNVLAAHGYIVLRFGWEHLDRPDYVVSTVRSALRAPRLALR
jgi:very-short-patch-repair endonuclease